MNKLIDLLKEETRQLKIDYIEKTVVWADKDFDNIRQRIDAYRSQGRKAYSSDREYYSEQKFVYSQPLFIVQGNKSEYISKRLKEANEHYEDSVVKLADRIIKKNMNIDMISVKSSYINHNLEAVFTDGEKTVKAFTVLAWGPVQRPHYRYLIK